MKITAIPFLLGAWMPWTFGWWGDIWFPISATIIFAALVATKQVSLL